MTRLVPWSLYQKARPRHRPFHIPAVDADTPEGRYAQIANSELQRWELFYLVLTFLSPLIGASLLRYATATVLGDQAVSWFSTGLFVLATGVRPWSHLIDRVSKRTEELHEFIHYPPPSWKASEDQHHLLEARIAQLEKTLAKFKTKTAHTSEDLLDYLNENLDEVERTLKKQEKKLEKYDVKFKFVERNVEQLRLHGKSRNSFNVDVNAVKTYLHNILEYILPFWLLPVSPRARRHSSKMPMRSLGHHPPSPTSVTPLETILEEDLENTKYPALGRPLSLASGLVYRAGSIATMPLRAVARMVLKTY